MTSAWRWDGRRGVAIAAALSLLGTGLVARADEPAAGSEQAAAAAAPALMPRELIEAASAYERFVERAGAIDAHFGDGEAIRTAMITAETYHPAQMGQGLVAYAALIALQDSRFVQGVRQAGATPAGAETLARALEADPRQIVGVDGAGEAAAHINVQVAEQAERIAETGRRVKQSAYDIQHEAWSRQTVPDGAARLAGAKALASLPVSPTAEDVAHLFQVAAAPRDYRGAPDADPPGLGPLVQRALTLAALVVLGRAERQELDSAGLMRERTSADCLQMAKLNLYQCLAVAGPHYEDIFCLGEHALKETGQCLREGAGLPPVVQAQAASAPRAAPTDAYAVPVAYASAAPR